METLSKSIPKSHLRFLAIKGSKMHRNYVHKLHAVSYLMIEVGKSFEVRSEWNFTEVEKLQSNSLFSKIRSLFHNRLD